MIGLEGSNPFLSRLTSLTGGRVTDSPMNIITHLRSHFQPGAKIILARGATEMSLPGGQNMIPEATGIIVPGVDLLTDLTDHFLHLHMMIMDMGLMPRFRKTSISGNSTTGFPNLGMFNQIRGAIKPNC